MTGIMEGKVALVTGGSTGIGKTTAGLLAREGAQVVIADINVEAGEASVGEIRGEGGEARFVQTDVSDEGDVERMVAFAVDEFGRLDGAFNNAGVFGRSVGARGFTHEIPVEAFDKLMSINLRGVFLCMKHEAKQMLLQGGGSIVSTSSIAGLRGLGGSAIYSASKHGVIGLTKAAAMEYADKGIRVNAVCPGWIRTERNSQLAAGRSEWEEQTVLATPMSRRGQTSEIGETVAWLLSDRSSFVTGQALAVDGGFTAGPSLHVFRGTP